ncbi:hypothetical protein ABL78_3149 [Leptomonas seymouri]|uniref:Importin N-terminal domain-containing protein n=1 Tax=Leptomonas seymouri TaxID=5684 RepID=A0A0N1IL61_LEPSE|nr:hypothetical protein ABL78_3149 [Leptomonas seymouri]|eukprot:KPI87740.1 hypothetical protein ABL78_3149 [Leptomonas seymouri]
MENTLLEVLLSRILSPDNVLRAAAEKELEQRSSTVPGFCVSLANYCERGVRNDEQRALALVALSVLKGSLLKSIHYQELQHVVALFLSHLNDAAVARAMTAATLRQWNSVVAAGVRRLAVLRASFAASQEPEAAAVAACFESVSNLITSQLLNTFAQLTLLGTAGIQIVNSHACLLQTLLEEENPEATRAWCAELAASCASPLLEILCATATDTHTTQGASSLCECRARCALQTRVAQTLCVLYEWQFAASRRSKFPADLKQAFIQAFPSLQTYILVPCSQWASSAASPFPASDTTSLPAVLSCASPLIAASLATQEFVVKVLQYGGWYSRCASPALLQGLLGSLEADAACYQALLCIEDSDEVDGGCANVRPTGARADSWVALGDEVLAEPAELVRRNVTQRWTLFHDAAFHPSHQRGFIDIVGDQCGRGYYELLLSYAVLAPSETDTWLDDPNTFLRAEDDRDDEVQWTARDTVAQLYTDSVTTLGPLFLHATLEDLNERLFSEGQDATAAADEQIRQGMPLPLMRREACLFFMEAVLHRCSKSLWECGAADFTPLAAHIWRYDVAGPTAQAVTTARALMLLTAIVEFSCKSPQNSAAAASPSPTSTALNTFMETAVSESAAVLAGIATNAPVSSTSSAAPPSVLLVAVVLCRFLQSTLPYWTPSVLEQHFASLQASLLALLSPQVDLTEEALYATVELLTDFLHAAQRAVQRSKGISNSVGQVSLVSEQLPGTVMDCWRRHVSDPSFADVVLQLLRRVVRDGGSSASGGSGTSGSSAVSKLLEELSWVNNVLSGYADSMAEVCAVPYFLRLLRSIFAHAPRDVANGAALLMLDSLCQLLLCTDESAILVASSSCLAALLRRCYAAESVQVHVATAVMEAALMGSSSVEEQSAKVKTELAAYAPRAAYPLPAVIVAIVLRTLQDARSEASLLEMGQTLVTIMRQSASFSEVDLLRVIHATVHRLGVVRTDTVTQQLLAPLAILLLLHPVALLRTLVQGGLLAETMGHWLPRVEHFENLSVTYSSCEGLLGLLQLLSEPEHASMTAEEGQQIAQQSVPCRWKLPEDVSGNAGLEKYGSKLSKKPGVRKKSSTYSPQQATLASMLAGGTVVETSLPLYAAILVAVGRGVLTLLNASVPALRRASASASVDFAADGEGSSFSDDDDDDATEGGRKLFQESGRDSSDGESSEESWMEVANLEDEGGNGDDAAVPSLSDAVAICEKAEKERIVAAMGAKLLPWMQKYSNEVSPYFTIEETQRLMHFFASIANSIHT